MKNNIKRFFFEKKVEKLKKSNYFKNSVLRTLSLEHLVNTCITRDVLHDTDKRDRRCV